MREEKVPGEEGFRCRKYRRKDSYLITKHKKTILQSDYNKIEHNKMSRYLHLMEFFFDKNLP
jgi:hypothetical protein